MSIQSNVNQAISLAGIVAATAGRDIAETQKIKREANRISKAFAEFKDKAAEKVEKSAEKPDNPEIAKQALEALQKETVAYEKEAEIAVKLFDKNPNPKTAEAKRRATEALTQHGYNVEAAEESYASFTQEDFKAHYEKKKAEAEKTKLEQKEAEAARNREAMREAELRRIRQLSPKSALRYEKKLTKKEAN